MNVFIRSALFLVLLTYLQPYIGLVSPLIQLIIVVFNILIYLVSKKTNDNKLENMDVELKGIEKITH